MPPPSFHTWDDTTPTTKKERYMTQIDVTGLDPAEVLMALYDAAQPQGMGFLHYDPAPMTRQEAESLLAGGTHFDYLRGRVMKVRIPADEAGASINPALYDRDNGEGAAARALAPLLTKAAS